MLRIDGERVALVRAAETRASNQPEGTGAKKNSKKAGRFQLSLLTHLVLEVELHTLDGGGDGLYK